MGDWGDYAVTKVRYGEDDEERLKHVKRREIEDGSVSDAKIARRRAVLMDIQRGEDHVTALEKEGKLKLQQEVDVVEGDDGREYLRVDGDEEPEDHLGGLPEF
jgi:hypothetical protein